jgi:hypothetical protein
VLYKFQHLTVQYVLTKRLWWLFLTCFYHFTMTFTGNLLLCWYVSQQTCPTSSPTIMIYEPRHDKTNVMLLQPAWIQTSLRSLIRIHAVRYQFLYML